MLKVYEVRYEDWGFRGCAFEGFGFKALRLGVCKV